MSQEQFSGEEKLEFRQIVLTHLKRILEISSHELRDTTTHTTHANYTETIAHEDTRYSYIQAVENLAYILMPYFDKHIQEKFSQCLAVMNGYGYQIKTWFEEELNQIKKDTGLSEVEGYAIIKKLEYAKILFIELNKLLKRNDYLKSAIYGEGSGEEVIDGDEQKEGEEE